MRSLVVAAMLALLPLAAHAQESKELVVTALTKLFVDKDESAIDAYWAEDYIQHNPNFPNGRDVLRGLVGAEGPDFTYEMGMVIAEGDLVAIHGRYTGFGPTPMIAVDIFRVEDGRIAEHWDILQEEVAETVSGNPMFAPQP